MNAGLLVNDGLLVDGGSLVRVDRRRRACRRLVVGLALTVQASCLGPTLSLETSEPEAAIYLDGAYVGAGSTITPQTYYGVAHVTIAPTRTGVIEDVRTSERRTIELPPPAPRWIFPFDFFVEAIARGFGDGEVLTIELALAPPTASLTAGVPPPDQEPLRARAAAIQLER